MTTAKYLGMNYLGGKHINVYQDQSDELIKFVRFFFI